MQVREDVRWVGVVAREVFFLWIQHLCEEGGVIELRAAERKYLQWKVNLVTLL